MKNAAIDDTTEAGRITHLLDAGLERLEPRIVHALQAGRHRALLRQRSKTALWPGNTALILRWPFAAHHPHLATALPLLLVLGIGTLTFWQHEKSHDMSHVDIAILTDDMPMEVFVDPHHY